MSCFYPLRIKTPAGENVKVPCGRCRGCRYDKSKDWALRCVHEASMHEKNAFVTLTYNDDHLPPGGVDRREMQLFMKRLRKMIEPETVRFYGCGEYGSKLGRPHYHILLFGYDFPDKEVVRVCPSPKSGRISGFNSYRLYKSPLLDSLWSKGFNTLGDVCMESAGYVARYVVKKIGGEMAKGHYNGKMSEFALMSRRPGIGARWFDKYTFDVYPKDFTTVKGRKFRPSRFYDKMLCRKHFDMYESVKEARKDRVEDPDCVRRRALDKYCEDITQTLTRRFEDG